VTAVWDPRALERLYDLLPSIYRERDAPYDFPLRALLEAIAEQVAAVEADIDQLYDDWFVETCQDWLMPFLGALVGYEPLPLSAEATQAPLEARIKLAAVIAPRGEVGNTIALRERKGTVRALEDVAFLVTGWPATAVELSHRVAITQSINAPYDRRGRIARITGSGARDELDGVGPVAASPAPFDTLGHLPDVRPIDSAHPPVGFGMKAVALHVWRLRSHRIERSPVAQKGGGLFTFDPTGLDRPLFNRHGGLGEYRAREPDLPVPLRRTALAADLDAYYGEGRALTLFKGTDPDTALPIRAQDIVIADLARVQSLAGRKVALDPETGRIRLPRRWRAPLWATYHQACAGDLGGGGYPRPPRPEDDLTWITYRLETQPGRWRPDPSDSVSMGAITDADPVRVMDASWRDGVATLAVERGLPLAVDAVVAVSLRHSPGFNGALHTLTSVYPVAVTTAGANSALDQQLGYRVIEITSSDRLGPTRVELTDGQTLVLRAADGQRPVLEALEVVGEGDLLELDGLLLAKPMRIEADLCELVIRHSTLVPGKARLDLTGEVKRLLIDHTILGRVELSHPGTITISESIVAAKTVLRAPTATATVDRCTFLGRLHVKRLAIGQDSIFAGGLETTDRDRSEARCCSLPPGTLASSNLYSCQVVERPRFTSQRYADPGYCQLAPECPQSIRTGAEDGGEMGAFHDRYEPHREALLSRRLAEFIPSSMTAEVVHAT
jgi:hypothetical protein